MRAFFKSQKQADNKCLKITQILKIKQRVKRTYNSNMASYLFFSYATLIISGVWFIALATAFPIPLVSGLEIPMSPWHEKCEK